MGHISNHHQSQMKQIEKQLILFFFSQLSTLQVVTETSSLICIKTKLLSHTCIKKLQFWIVASPPTDPLPHPRRFYSNICGSIKESYQRKVGQVMCTGRLGLPARRSDSTLIVFGGERVHWYLSRLITSQSNLSLQIEGVSS